MQKCMDWNRANFDWNKTKALLVVAEEGSLSGAARRLGVAQPTIGRQIASLEQELGVTLIDRTGHGVILTEAGLALAEHTGMMAEGARRIALTASGNAQAIEGTVRITATEGGCVHYLAPIIAELHEQEPGIRIELIGTDEVRDLSKREADIALRTLRPTTPDLYVRMVREDVGRLYASKTYLDRWGRIDEVEDIRSAKLIGFDNNAPVVAGLNAAGVPVDDSNFVILTSSYLAMWEMVKAGVGGGLNLESIGDEEPTVERILPFMPGLPVQFWLVTHKELKTSRRIRLVFDFLADRLSSMSGPVSFVSRERVRNPAQVADC